MSNELTVFNVSLPGTLIDATSDVFRSLTTAGDFLDRIQLFTKGQFVDNGAIGPGHYGVPSGETVLDLGKEIDIFPLDCRAKALDIRDKDAIVVSYDPDSPLFKEIQALAKERDSHCMCGPTFLVFERSTAKFYELFAGVNKSMLREAPKIAACLQKNPVTLKTQYVKKKSYSWWAPVCVACSTPFANCPTQEEVLKQIEKFRALKSSEVEVVAEAPATSKRAR
ncbi:MAG: hypothetical protein AMXMBFR16_10500 [Candidatus Uhrbacteria bacterium]